MVKGQIGVIAGTLLVGLLLGRLSAPAGRSGNAEADAAAERPRRSAGRDSDALSGSATSYVRMQQEIRHATPEKVAGLLYRALECNDPNEREILACQCLAAIDAGNWRECLDQFSANRRDTGRDHRQLWEQCVVRVGQVAGQESMDTFRKIGLLDQSVQSWKALYGWATTDPDSASRWLADVKTTEPDHYKRLLPAIAGGSALKNADAGMRLMAGLPEAERRDCIGAFTDNLVQNGGLDLATAWMSQVRASDPEGAYSQEVTNEVLKKVFGAHGVQEVAARMEQLSGLVKFDDSRLSQALDEFHGEPAGLTLLAELSQGPILKDQAASPSVLPRAIFAMIKRDPATVADWFQANPSAPFLESAAVQACQLLKSQGKHEEADRVVTALPEGSAKSAAKAVTDG